MQPHAEIKSLIKERLHFQMSKIVDYSSFFQGNNYGDVSLSPYNTFLLIEIVDKNNNGFWKQLFQYKNRSLINYQNCDNMKDEFRKHKSRGCIFMKNTNEFIVWYQEEIIFCRIEQNQKWKTIQVIQKTPVCSVALSTDEQTLFVCDPILSLYKNNKLQIRFGFVFFRLPQLAFIQMDFFLIQLAILSLQLTFLLSGQQKIIKIKKYGNFYNVREYVHIQYQVFLRINLFLLKTQLYSGTNSLERSQGNINQQQEPKKQSCIHTIVNLNFTLLPLINN